MDVGIYALQTVWGDELTLANILAAMLLVSDNTAVRMCGRVVPGPEINEVLAPAQLTVAIQRGSDDRRDVQGSMYTVSARGRILRGSSDAAIHRRRARRPSR